jgi:hypothetical protein
MIFSMLALGVIVQLLVAVFWIRPLFVTGLPLFSTRFDDPGVISTSRVAEWLDTNRPATLAYRVLSEHEVGVRRTLSWGFTGVQGVISTQPEARFAAALGWPAAIVYFCAVLAVATDPRSSVLQYLMWYVILTAVPTIDILLMRRTLFRMDQALRSA